MLLEAEFVMRAEDELELPQFTGYISRGILLNLIRQVDPSSSQSLHESNVAKPYSVTPLYFRSKRRTELGYILDPSSPLSFKIRFLNEKHANELLRTFEKRRTIMIRDKTLRIDSVRVRAESYEALMESASPAVKLYFEFLTPTRFAALGREKEYLFPEQKKVFGGLLELWNRFSGLPLGETDAKAYMEWLGSSSWVSSYILRTELKDTSKGRIIGFTGKVAYNFDGDERWQRTTSCLAAFANFSNVGKGRTSGFGVVRTEIKCGQEKDEKERVTQRTEQQSRGP
ncbi:MAG: CRISPR-associated endoribonuclease Cas6 [Candidatus Verstraetearchaeota archaeon]|nr:CRISPR-associated endoribonuclease Cas6 [Candidatus Verstraetearchaeota archaeon]